LPNVWKVSHPELSFIKFIFHLDNNITTLCLLLRFEGISWLRDVNIVELGTHIYCVQQNKRVVVGFGSSPVMIVEKY